MFKFSVMLALFLHVSMMITSSSLLSLNNYEMLALKALYMQTDGPSWTWEPLFHEFGRPWNFTYQSNPCADEWQVLVFASSSSNVIINQYAVI